MLHLNRGRFVTGLAPVKITRGEVAVGTMRIRSATAKTSPMTWRLYTAFRIVTFEAEILLMAWLTTHPVGFRVKTMSSIDEKKRVTCRLLPFVAIETK
jgi:hypothetical protein